MPNTYEFVGGPLDGQVEVRPDDKAIVVFEYDHINHKKEAMGFYEPGTGSQRGKMIWHPEED